MPRPVLLALGVLLALTAPLAAGQREPLSKLDGVLRAQLRDGRRADAPLRVIVQATDVGEVERTVAALGGATGKRLAGGQAVVALLPSAALERLAEAGSVRSVSLDRRMTGVLDRTAEAVGAKWVADNLGFEGSGVGVAIIDSGVTRAHDDLGGNRVVHFVDFVDMEPRPHDQYGHGTHVAGIIAGSGYDSGGARRGIAPGAHLVVLKTLDGQGEGFISNAIAAMDYAIEQRAAFNIRVINLSVAASVYESYRTDPLTQAAARAVEAGIVVVTAAGNQGRTAKGEVRYQGITAPGNAPWVLTVGAANHHGTVDRSDDTIAPFSSLGPTAIDGVAKPDLVAPGVGIESLADRSSTLFAKRPDARLWGTVPTETEPYLSLSGTSMAAPVVTGTVALMLEANPALKPAEVKAILEASADPNPAFSPLAQGAGFLNARAAVTLAHSFGELRGSGVQLEALVQRYAPIESPAAGTCEASDGSCAPSSPAPPDTVVGTTVPARDTVVWGSRGSRPTSRRRSSRSAGRPRRTRENGSQATTGNAGVSE
jgi:serine protease AprX